MGFGCRAGLYGVGLGVRVCGKGSGNWESSGLGLGVGYGMGVHLAYAVGVSFVDVTLKLATKITTKFGHKRNGEACVQYIWFPDSESDSFGRGTARAEDAQGKPTQSHISPSILAYEETIFLPGSAIEQCGTQ